MNILLLHRYHVNAELRTFIQLNRRDYLCEQECEIVMKPFFKDNYKKTIEWAKLSAWPHESKRERENIFQLQYDLIAVKIFTKLSNKLLFWLWFDSSLFNGFIVVVFRYFILCIFHMSEIYSFQLLEAFDIWVHSFDVATFCFYGVYRIVYTV